jgi:serine/threonine protein kinase
VLISDVGRALLTDFGLSKTENTISHSATTKSTFYGGTLAYTAPEVLNAVKGKASTQLFTAKSDVYSYGIVIFEVLAAAYPTRSTRDGELSSIPWHNYGFVDIITAVAQGLRPTLAQAAITDTNVLKAGVYTNLMQQCLDGNPSVRPTFADVVSAIE